MRGEKPLGRKAYGSIPHLPGSRLGPGDHACHDGQARIATERARDKHDRIIVQPKLDGSNCSVAKIDGLIVPLGRAGYRAESSPYEMHHLFADWVFRRHSLFDTLLSDGERVVGEWLIQAHGTLYSIQGDDCLFAPFDIMRGGDREIAEIVQARTTEVGLTPIPSLETTGSVAIEDALAAIEGERDSWPWTPQGMHEGAVWRIERAGRKNGKELPWAVDFLVKYVRPEKVDGVYLDGSPVWNDVNGA